MASPNPTDVKLVEIEDGVEVIYADYTFENYTRTTVITITCTHKDTPAVLHFENEEYIQGHSRYYFSMHSKHACPIASEAGCVKKTPQGTIDLTKLASK
jgi:hypothetical protein